MKLTPQRPVTIDKVQYGERWFPRLYRHTDQSLLLYIEYGHDRHFSPDFRLRSTDGGKTWGGACDNTPRTGWCHSFADGELYELDVYGVDDPKHDGYAGYFAAWSRPGNKKSVRKEIIRVHAPSGKKMPLTALSRTGYPTFHWWPLWNTLHGTDQLKGDEIHLSGPTFFSGMELDGKLIATAAGDHRDPTVKGNVLWLFESTDRGRTWEERAEIARDPSAPEGVNESTIVRLRDGRLYVIARTGDRIIHTWSSDQGKTWTPPQPIRLIDEPDHTVRICWPVCRQLADGTLVLVYGRPGKNVVFDPTGTGTQWQGRLDLHAWELDTQASRGVPPEQRLNNSVGLGVRYWNSGDYLFLVPDGPPEKREMLVGYDVQHYVEEKDADPVSGVRMVRVRLED
jgi:hypothetical protein